MRSEDRRSLSSSFLILVAALVSACGGGASPAQSRGDVLDFSSLSWGGSWDVFGDVQVGVKYWLQVMYYGGSTPQVFTLQVTRPT